MKTLKKFFTIVLAFCILTSCLPIAFAADPAFGQCGDNVFCKYDVETETLTFYGSGATYNYTDAYTPPWGGGVFTNVRFESGITHIGNLLNLNAENYYFSETVKDIARYCIADSYTKSFTVAENNPYFKVVDDILYTRNMKQLIACPATKTGSVVVPEGVTEIREYAFWGCNRITTLTLPKSLITIGNNAFSNCGITELTIPANVETIEDSAFFNCKNLKNITILGKPAISRHTPFNYAYFNHVYGNCYTIDKQGYSNAQFAAGAKFVSIGHAYSEWKITREAIPTEQGIKERFCTVCNAKETEYFDFVNIPENEIVILSEKNIESKVGDTHAINVVVTRTNGNKTVLFTSDNNNVATVNQSGIITAKGPGMAKITVKLVENPQVEKTITITVLKPVEKIITDKSSYSLPINGTTSIITTLVPEDAFYSDLTFTSSATSIVTVDENGKLFGISPGTTTVIITAASGVSTTVLVTVTNIPVTHITSFAPVTTLYSGETTTITNTFYPVDSNRKFVKYTSSNSGIVYVDKTGKVTANSTGTATITITSVDDDSVFATINFTVKQIPYCAVFIPDKMNINETADITVSTKTELGYEVSHTVADSSIVRINDDGTITSIGEGKTEITTTIILEDGYVITKINNVKVDDPNVEPRCSMCNTYEASIGTPLEIFYKIFHAIAHFFGTMFA